MILLGNAVTRLLLIALLACQSPALAQEPISPQAPQAEAPSQQKSEGTHSVGSGYSWRFEGDRSLDEVQQVFERNRNAFAAIYKRAANDSQATPQGGQIIVSLEIAPSGEVTNCKLVSSSFNSPDFERKIIQRVLFLRFHARETPSLTLLNYPIVFRPLN